MKDYNKIWTKFCFRFFCRGSIRLVCQKAGNHLHWFVGFSQFKPRINDFIANNAENIPNAINMAITVSPGVNPTS